MKRFMWMMVAIAALLAISACTLNSANSVRETSMDATQTALPLGVSTLDDLSGSSIPGGSSGILATPVLQSNQTATSCGKLRVNVGTDPKGTLRLREQPNNTSTVVLLIPNNTLVTKVAASQEIDAGGYTWVNIQYTDPNGVIATGWAAKNGMKNQLTLTAAGC